MFGIFEELGWDEGSNLLSSDRDSPGFCCHLRPFRVPLEPWMRGPGDHALEEVSALRGHRAARIAGFYTSFRVRELLPPQIYGLWERRSAVWATSALRSFQLAVRGISAQQGKLRRRLRACTSGLDECRPNSAEAWPWRSFVCTLD